MAAPALGGAIGTYFMGFSGAAAVNAGLAWVGGGAITAGGFGMAGGTAAVTTVFGGGGAVLAAKKMATLTGDLAEFELETLGGNGAHVVLCVSGWLSQQDDFRKTWAAMSAVYAHGERVALRWESKHLLELGKGLGSLCGKAAAKTAAEVWAKRASKVAARSLTWPLLALQALNAIDNPWHVATNRAEKAGKALAAILRERALGRRPVSLYGFSLGARTCFHAVEDLASTSDAGIVSDLVLMGGAVTADPLRWGRVRKVVAGRVVNAFSTSDWILAYLYRPAQWATDAAGLAPIASDGVENIDVTDLANGHLAYRSKLSRILCRIGVDGLECAAPPPDTRSPVAAFLEIELYSRIRDRAVLPDVDAVYQFRVDGEGGGAWVVDVRPTRREVRPGVQSDATCTIEISADDFMRIVQGEVSHSRAFWTGMMKVSGDLEAALKLRPILT
jgi:hypothetical protein